jgi:hypothetical protein
VKEYPGPPRAVSSCGESFFSSPPKRPDILKNLFTRFLQQCNKTNMLCPDSQFQSDSDIVSDVNLYDG